jgi:hypothetical protein
MNAVEYIYAELKKLNNDQEPFEGHGSFPSGSYGLWGLCRYISLKAIDV